jgi:carboxypeptidase Taq
LIDCFEHGTKTADLKQLFNKLKIELTCLLKKLQTHSDPVAPFFDLEYDHDTQLAMGKMVLEEMGFSKQTSRLDESIHPMCTPMHPNDIRMTTWIYPKQVYANILSCAHEGGHGLYHANLPLEKFGPPLCETASHGIDKSQFRTWKTIIGRSLS